MDAEYDVWFRDPRNLLHNLIANPDFQDEFDYAPYHEYVDGQHIFEDFMSGDWAWTQAVCMDILLLFMFLILTSRVG